MRQLEYAKNRNGENYKLDADLNDIITTGNTLFYKDLKDYQGYFKIFLVGDVSLIPNWFRLKCLWGEDVIFHKGKHNIYSYSVVNGLQVKHFSLKNIEENGAVSIFNECFKIVKYNGPAYKRKSVKADSQPNVDEPKVIKDDELNTVIVDKQPIVEDKFEINNGYETIVKLTNNCDNEYSQNKNDNNIESKYNKLLSMFKLSNILYAGVIVFLIVICFIQSSI